MTTINAAKVTLQNLNHPGYAKQVDAPMYEAMKRAFLKVLPKAEPGLTFDELAGAVLKHLPEDLYPGGAKAGWYTKAVQMDLEARGIIVRAKSRPLRLHTV
jgi:hypothetical protein